MEKKTTQLSALEASLNSEAECLVRTLHNAIPKKTHLIPLVFALARLLLSLISTHCRKIPKNELSNIIKQIIEALIGVDQQQKKEGKDTPDENQEPQPQL